MAQKYYVVWKGRKTGIFTNWTDCQAQINGFADARYKSFTNEDQAQKAFSGNYYHYIGHTKTEPATLTPSELKKIGYPISPSICVDAAWNTATGVMEYQGVRFTDFQHKDPIFKQGPYADATNNIGEFLAIVHALEYLKETQFNLPIYSDSKVAILWVAKKKAATTLIQTALNTPAFDAIAHAEAWLQKHTYKTKILKWETKAWGENPADFGRK